MVSLGPTSTMANTAQGVVDTAQGIEQPIQTITSLIGLMWRSGDVHVASNSGKYRLWLELYAHST